MYKTIYIYLGCFVLFFLMVGVRAISDRRSRQKRFREQMKAQWGQASKRSYSPQQMEKLTHYFYLKEQNDFVIDDITWKDLDMDRVFRQMNHTNSSIGEEYLYQLLRTPVFDKDELEKRDAFIRFFMEHEEERLQVQEIYGNIGRTKHASVIGYLTEFQELKVKKTVCYSLHQLALVISMAGIFWLPQLFIVLFIMALAWNVAAYFREKRRVEVYLEAFSYISNTLKKVSLFQKVQEPFLKPYTEELVALADKMKAFRNGCWLLKSGSDLSGGLEDVIMDYVRVLFHVDLQQFNKMLRQLYVHEADLLELYEKIGYLESMLVIASYRKFLGSCSVPVFTNCRELYMEELYHPLIEAPVANSIHANKGVLLTGSNASGKSTFLRTVAINALLAQTIATVCAKKCSMPFAKIYSSMALQDHLEREESYYIVEIKALKRILDASGDMPVLCFVDEVLRGTNTVERIAASSELLLSLNQKNIICFAASHDIELTYLLEQQYDNYHFSEEIDNGQVLFNYKLQKGRTASRNAIKLLEVMGYDETIILRAQNRAQHFLESNEWCL